MYNVAFPDTVGIEPITSHLGGEQASHVTKYLTVSQLASILPHEVAREMTFLSSKWIRHAKVSQIKKSCTILHVNQPEVVMDLSKCEKDWFVLHFAPL